MQKKGTEKWKQENTETKNDTSHHPTYSVQFTLYFISILTLHRNVTYLHVFIYTFLN